MQQRAEAADLGVGEVLARELGVDDLRDEIGAITTAPLRHDALPVHRHLAVGGERRLAREIGAAQRVEVPLQEPLAVGRRKVQQHTHRDRRDEMAEVTLRVERAR